MSPDAIEIQIQKSTDCLSYRVARSLKLISSTHCTSFKTISLSFFLSLFPSSPTFSPLLAVNPSPTSQTPSPTTQKKYWKPPKTFCAYPPSSKPSNDVLQPCVISLFPLPLPGSRQQYFPHKFPPADHLTRPPSLPKM
jgi:hypothetical protein